MLSRQSVAFLLFFAFALSAAQTGFAQQAGLSPGQLPDQTTPVGLRGKVVEAFSGAQALVAATWGCPLVIMYNLRYNDAVGPKPKAPPNSIWRMEDISTPKLSREAGYVTPNVNTLYGFGFLDLGPQPVILSVPDSGERYYMVEIVDMWTNAFAYAGGVATGYKGGMFALVGPGWKGSLPPHLRRIDCPTRWIMIQPRVHVRESGDLPGARKVLQAITVQGLAQFTGERALPVPTYNYAAPDLKDPDLPVSAMDFKDPLQFWEILSAAMNENPPPEDQVKALLPMFEPLGLEPGKAWDRSKVNPIVLNSMKTAAANIGAMLSQLPQGANVDGWQIPSPTLGNFGTNYLLRAVVARVGLTANTPREAIYYLSPKDREGNWFTGAQRYTVTFAKTPPVITPGFWSLTMYDSENNYTVPNQIDRYSLGSDNKGMKFNHDGSLTIYVQNESPGPDREANWLPAPPDNFYLILRSYAPGQAMVKSLTDRTTYAPPAVALVK